MLENLSTRLQGIFSGLRGKGRLTEDDINDAMREIRMALLEADVNFKVVKSFVARTKERCLDAEVLDSLTPAQNVIKIVLDELTELLGRTDSKLVLSSRIPNVIMLVGLQGSGKTTAAAKLAYRLKQENHSPLLVACDVYRPAAADQLETLGGEIGVRVYRGGGALSIKQVTGKPIKFISSGEKPDSLEEFHPDRMAKRILGMGDVVSLIESAVKVQQEEVEQEQAERMMRANLTLNDFIDMNRQIRKMGGVSKLLSALPGGDKAMAAGQVDENAFDHMEVIINSMSKAEREKPELLNGSRRARIAAGAGVSVSDVNQLMKKFNETKKMMKKMMPAVEEMQGGKKGKKGKKGRRRRMADLKKLQDMLGE